MHFKMQKLQRLFTVLVYTSEYPNQLPLDQTAFNFSRPSLAISQYEKKQTAKNNTCVSVGFEP